MSITVTNHSNTKVWVSVTMLGSDRDQGGSEGFFALNANGGSDTWNYRKNWQVAYITRADNAGAELETKVAIPGQTIHVY
ncbi:hypothetical protein D9757_009730 [Collybiopsis confluens]|uniref:Uncharacterized protein n=1 Tax=Collybiopsis confluens TaxID=2823264 RepID=A0A8H5M1R1_9AGAR|nr:hypothetical protein D9757_009730 [Collybiopsis confluens]